MAYRIVDVRVTRDRNEELKISDELTAEELVHILAQVFHEEELKGKVIQAEPLGRILGKDEILAEAGIGSGAQLTLI